MSSIKENVKYPEHEKMQNVRAEHEAIEHFIDWYENQGYRLHQYDKRASDDLGYPHYRTLRPVDLIAEFFDIDTNKFENEKIQMLEEIRNANKNG